jgi:hypothetical protein
MAISTWLKAQFCKTLIIPILLYGAETWTMEGQSLARIRKAFNQICRIAANMKSRRMHGRWIKASPREARRRLNMPTLPSLIHEANLRLAGQITRAPADHLLNQAGILIEVKPLTRGKVRKSLATQVRTALAATNTRLEDAADERRWASLIKAPRPRIPTARKKAKKAKTRGQQPLVIESETVER